MQLIPFAVSFLVGALLFGSDAVAAHFHREHNAENGDREKLEETRRILFRKHMDCASQATERLMSPGAASDCADIYLRLKLTFLPGVDAEGFKTFSPETRARINRITYVAYRSWLQRQLALAPTSEGEYPKPAQ